MQFPLATTTTITGGPYSAGTTQMTVANGATLIANDEVFIPMNSGRWYNGDVSVVSGNTITITPAIPPGDSIVSGAIVGGTGWNAYNYLNPQMSIAADTVTPNTFYGVNNLSGLYKWTLCGSSEYPNQTMPGGGTGPTLVAPSSQGFLYQVFFQVELKAVPGQAGHLFLTATYIDQTNHPANTLLWRACNGQSNSVTMSAMPGFWEPFAVGFGHPKPGGLGYPTIMVTGFYDPNWATDGGGIQGNSIYGTWRSVDDPNNGVNGTCNGQGTFQKLGNQMIWATSSWTTSNTTIPVTTCNNTAPGMAVYDNTANGLVGYVTSCPGNILTLTADASIASVGARDQIAVGDFPVGWVRPIKDMTGDVGDYTKIYGATGGYGFFTGTFP